MSKPIDAALARRAVNTIKFLSVDAVEQVRELDEVTWFSEVWGRRPTCRAVIEHCQRIMAADLSYPVIFAPEGPPHHGCILDGMHRIAKTMAEALKSGSVSPIRIVGTSSTMKAQAKRARVWSGKESGAAT